MWPLRAFVTDFNGPLRQSFKIVYSIYIVYFSFNLGGIFETSYSQTYLNMNFLDKTSINLNPHIRDIICGFLFL